jgi:homoserine dehydrogenase
MAHAGEALQDLADENGANLHYSAAVGGAMPALEAVKRARAAGPLRRIVGVLNGTTNFVIEQLASGQTFSAAVTTAQERGYAEAQPKLDLNGIDAAQKLILLARAAFDVSLPIHRIAIRGIDGLNAEALRKVEARGQTVRLVAECSRSGHGLVASVKPMELPLLHRLAQARGAENCLVIEPEAGDALTVSGEGAGRWPTTEAVMSDLFEIQRNRMVEQRPEELEECVA